MWEAQVWEWIVKERQTLQGASKLQNQGWRCKKLQVFSTKGEKGKHQRSNTVWVTKWSESYDCWHSQGKCRQQKKGENHKPIKLRGKYQKVDWITETLSPCQKRDSCLWFSQCMAYRQHQFTKTDGLAQKNHASYVAANVQLPIYLEDVRLPWPKADTSGVTTKSWEN